MPVAVVKLLPVVTPIFTRSAMVIPLSPTTEVKAPRPTTSAPRSAARLQASTILRVHFSGLPWSNCEAVSGQPTNQPSVSAPVRDFTPVIHPQSWGGMTASAASTHDLGRYRANAYLRSMSLVSSGCSRKPNLVNRKTSLGTMKYE